MEKQASTEMVSNIEIGVGSVINTLDKGSDEENSSL